MKLPGWPLAGWTGHLPSGGLAGLAAVVALVGAGGLAGLALVDDDGDGEPAAAAPSSTTTTFASTLPPTTATTVAPAPTTSSSAAPLAAPTTVARVTTTAARPTASTTAAPATNAAGVCGSGKATVAFVAKDLVTDALSSSFTPQATVDNQVTAPIQVDELVVEVLYPGNDVRTVRFATTGTVIAPGTSASFTAERITTTKQYESARFTRFTYFTQGQPTACRVSAA